MGDKILAPIRRESKCDFRSNFSLGGNVTIGIVDDEILNIISKLRHALGFDFVGIDFIRHNKEWILNEIEDVVGTRMLYSITDIDAANEYIKYILEKLKIG
jgi:glutathione synthase/RimK-type ligase-like ATP-grasp enzyme